MTWWRQEVTVALKMNMVMDKGEAMKRWWEYVIWECGELMTELGACGRYPKALFLSFRFYHYYINNGEEGEER